MQNKLELNVKGMHCASCVVKVEKAIKKIHNVNLATEKATVNFEGNLDLKQVRKEVQRTGYDIEMPSKHDDMSMPGHDHAAMLKENEIRDLKKKIILSAILSVLILIGTYQEFLGIN